MAANIVPLGAVLPLGLRHVGPIRVLIRRDPCAYCGAPRGGTVDHIEPRARGGADRPENMAGACRRCNELKGTWPLLAYLLAAPHRSATQNLSRWG